MTRIERKLNSSRGAAVLIAMLVLLIVVAVSSVIVTAAMANASRIEKRNENQQVYLAAQSAADIICKDLSGNMWSELISHSYFEPGAHSWEVVSSWDPARYPFIGKINSALPGILESGTSASFEIPVNFTGGDGGADFSGVNIACSLIMNPSGATPPGLQIAGGAVSESSISAIRPYMNAFIVIVATDAENPDDMYAITLRLNAQITKYGLAANGTTTPYFVVQWNYAGFSKGINIENDV